MDFEHYVPLAARLMEIAGIVVMVAGPLLAAALILRTRREAGATIYKAFRQRLGRAILLGLEFLVAADIIRTVSEVPTLERVTVLAVIVAIRTFLSFTLEVELEGRPPWRKATQASGPTSASP